MSAYFARILGYSPLDLYTSMSYVLFYPVGQKREFLHDHGEALRDASPRARRGSRLSPRDDARPWRAGDDPFATPLGHSSIAVTDRYARAAGGVVEPVPGGLTYRLSPG